MDFEDVAVFDDVLFADLLAVYVQWANTVLDWREARNLAAKALEFPYADYRTKVAAAIPAGQGPDVVQLFEALPEAETGRARRLELVRLMKMHLAARSRTPADGRQN